MEDGGVPQFGLAVAMGGLWIAFTVWAVRKHGRLGWLALFGAPFVLIVPLAMAFYLAACTLGPPGSCT
jgi:hypothetical protein